MNLLFMTVKSSDFELKRSKEKTVFEINPGIFPMYWKVPLKIVVFIFIMFIIEIIDACSSEYF